MISWPSKSTLQRLLDLAGLHFTTSERSGPFRQSMLHKFLSRPWSFLGWTTAMLFWLDFHQTQSNLYKWFRMQRHDWSSTSPKEYLSLLHLQMLHLSLSPCTGYQLQLVSSSRHWWLHIEQQQALHPPTSTHYYESTSPPEVWDLLVSDASCTITERLKITLQNILIHHSWLVDDLPTPIRNAGSLSIFKQQLKTHLFKHYLTSKYFFLISFSISSSFSLPFSSSLASLYLFEQCLRLGVRGTSSFCLPLQD